MSLHLYHHNSSVCAAKVRIALAEKGLAWDGTLMTLKGDQFDPSYLQLNPNAVVPTLVHDGRAIIESNVILEYLDDAFPTPPLRPAAPADRADMRLLFQRLDDPETGIHRAVSVITFGAAYRHFLIDEAGGTDSRPPAAGDRPADEPERAARGLRTWFCSAPSRGRSGRPLPAWTPCSTILNVAWERPTG